MNVSAPHTVHFVFVLYITAAFSVSVPTYSLQTFTVVCIKRTEAHNEVTVESQWHYAVIKGLQPQVYKYDILNQPQTEIKLHLFEIILLENKITGRPQIFILECVG